MRGVKSSSTAVSCVSPSVKKRNIKGQISNNMNKSTSMNEVKKIMQKNQAGNPTSNSGALKTTKGFYKTAMKPQSFV